MTDVAQQHHCTRPWYMRPPVWLLGVVLLGLTAFGIVEMIGKPPITAYSAFLDQLDAGNVVSVTFQGTQIDGRFRNAVGNMAANGGAPQTDFRSRVPDFGDPNLIVELRKQHVAIDVVSSSNWTSLLARLPWPMVAFLAFIMIAGFVRLLRGGSAQPGSATTMHAPMQGMIGLLSGLFKRGEPTPPPEPRL